MEIEQILDQISPLSSQSIQLIADKMQLIQLPKNTTLIDADKVEKKLYFIKKGIVRAYIIDDGKEITFWFGKEGDLILSMRSYVENKISYETIELMEDCELYEIKSSDLQLFYATNLEIANWGRKLAEIELIKTEERFISRQLGTAIDRYKKLLEENPSLINRVQLGYIASYLGISQVTLSRIRAEI
ncbi:Crp/Fnr family transcriptional regulator [Empedobacter falsenii]|uniref:Crp/Fnr family transcriptional regulator n=1 Tax=Empedobacter falsenii TaxID=343874 RepID=A0A7H9DU11_9FLAO|nr:MULTISPECIES: Crp/Fnr family transcriptional regulator [Empedobacter]MDH2206565.1 Crp/Fnr family transcriptional regulator [Empedobacter sp. GD03644]MDM1040246.1 Crp/Fnr family transcriptional regulator [Empedobacter brevis]MDM1134178.1 Crp/Fnr family transcriptional regulator [Empedobacter sp. R750]QLL58226.1 Crp/Fnr family transcriptional regulator [Empedobacter falsenii]